MAVLAGTLLRVGETASQAPAVWAYDPATNSLIAGTPSADIGGSSLQIARRGDGALFVVRNPVGGSGAFGSSLLAFDATLAYVGTTSYSPTIDSGWTGTPTWRPSLLQFVAGSLYVGYYLTAFGGQDQRYVCLHRLDPITLIVQQETIVHLTLSADINRTIPVALAPDGQTVYGYFFGGASLDKNKIWTCTLPGLAQAVFASYGSSAGGGGTTGYFAGGGGSVLTDGRLVIHYKHQTAGVVDDGQLVCYASDGTIAWTFAINTTGWPSGDHVNFVGIDHAETGVWLTGVDDETVPAVLDHVSSAGALLARFPSPIQQDGSNEGYHTFLAVPALPLPRNGCAAQLTPDPLVGSSGCPDDLT